MKKEEKTGQARFPSVSKLKAPKSYDNLFAKEVKRGRGYSLLIHEGSRKSHVMIQKNHLSRVANKGEKPNKKIYKSIYVIIYIKIGLIFKLKLKKSKPIKNMIV